MQGKTYYNILEIRMDASSQEIKEAHRKMLLKYHPDKLPSEQLKRYNEISKKRDKGERLSVEDERWFKEINDITGQIKIAYAVLSNPIERAKYDEKLNDELMVLTQKSDRADKLYTDGKHQDALIIYRDVYKKRSEILGFDHPETVKVKNKIISLLNRDYSKANELDKQGRYQEAVDAYNEVYKQQEEILGSNQQSTLRTKNSIALILYKQGKYQDALNVYDKVYQKQKEVLEPDNPSILRTRSNMASVLYHQSKYKEALEIYREVYQIKKRDLGKDNLSTLLTRSNIAFLLYKSSEYSESLKVYKDICQIVMTLKNHSNYEDALKVYERVYKDQREILGVNHTVTLETKNDLIGILTIQNEIANVLYRQESKYKEALKIFEEVYQKRKEFLGSDHYDTLATRKSIAIVLNKQSEYKKALEIFEEVYKKQKEILGLEHKETISTKNRIIKLLDVQIKIASKLYIQEDKYKEACDIYANIYRKSKEILGLDMVEVLSNQGQYKEALTTLNNIAVALDKHGKYNEYLKTYKEVYQKIKNIFGSDYTSMLHYAAKNGHKEVVQFLLNEGANINAIDKDGNTPLYSAAEGGALNVVKYLIEEKHIDLNLKGTITDSSLGYIPLHFASKEGKLNVVEYLIGKGANINAKDKDNITPLHLAALKGHKEVVDALLNKGALVDAKDKDNLTPLHYAAINDHKEVVDALLNKDANFEAKAKDDVTPLHYAAIKGHKEIVNALLDKGALVYAKDKVDITPLHLAVLKGHKEVVDALLNKGALVDAKDKDNLTPLHYAAIKGHKEVVDALLNKDALVNAKDKDGYTPLHRAADEGHLDIVKLLMEKNAKNKQQCPSTKSLGRNKREAVKCELSWNNDIKKIREGEEDIMDISNLKINSDKFIDYIKSISENKRTQLIQLAGQVTVTGKSQGLLNKLISNHKFINHLSKVGMISGATMQGMMVKNVLADAVNGNYQGVAINVGFIAGDQGFAKIAEVASLKGLKLASEGKLLLSSSLIAASPFLARSTSAFIVYDLIKQIKEYNRKNSDSLGSIIGDSLYLGNDAIAIGIETAEISGVLEGISSLIEPISAIVGAFIFVGTDVYSAIERVNQINKMVHLSTEEKLLEFTRAFLKMEPEAKIKELAEEVSIYKKLINHAIQYLENNNHIQRYVFSTGKLTVKECKESDVTFPSQVPPSSILASSILSSPRTKQEKCTTEFQEDLNNIIILSHQEKYNHFCSLDTNALNSDRILCSPAKSLIPLGEDKLIRVFYLNKETRFIKYLSSIRQTDHNKVASVLLHPKRECGSYKDISTLSMIGMSSVFARQFELKEGYEYMDEQPSYLCHNAIGIEYKHNRKGNHTLIQLENGNDIAIGFRESPNIFISKNGNKTITGGDKEDIFIFIGNYITGSIDGMSGENTLDLSEFAPQENVIHLNRDNIKYSNASIAIQNINKILGRRNREDNIDCTCDMNYVNGQGGKDVVTIKDYGCFYKLNLVVKERNTVLNEGRGNFNYFIAPSKQQGQALISFPLHYESNHTITLNYTLSDIDRIDVQSTNRTKFYISLFNLTIENTKNPTQYLFSNESRLEIYNKNNIYIFHKISEVIEEIVTYYSNIANKLGAYIFIRSELNNETALIGHRNHDVLYSDPYHTSHLVGNGGENIFVVTSDLTNKLPIPAVILYDLDQENKIDTLDLRQIRKQVENDLNVKVKIRIIISDKDLIIQLFYENKVSEHVFKLKNELICEA